ncbi:MAG: hypothetical protein H0T79_05825 [Deltaproteobacteria bacterium]|nr:hypothetical protein [Deltaproteobacteria bacterium]
MHRAQPRLDLGVEPLLLATAGEQIVEIAGGLAKRLAYSPPSQPRWIARSQLRARAVFSRKMLSSPVIARNLHALVIEKLPEVIAHSHMGLQGERTSHGTHRI